MTLQDDFEVHAITNGNEAITRLAGETPRIILLDLNLLEVSGEAILAFVRSNKRLQKAVVILCTANEGLADTLREEADFILLIPHSFIHFIWLHNCNETAKS